METPVTAEPGVKALEFHAEFDDPAADVVIVSSDNVGFRTHRYFLQAGSKVLRDLAIHASHSDKPRSDGNRIELTDVKLETVEVIRFFLCALEGRSLPRLTSDNFAIIEDALDLTDKYDCPTARTILLHHLMRSMPFPGDDWTCTDPFDLFQLAAKHEDAHLASLALSQAGAWSWTIEAPDKNKGTLEKVPSSEDTLSTDRQLDERPTGFTSVFDVSAWTIRELNALRPTYTLALLRATRDAQLPTKTTGDMLRKVDWKPIAKTFRGILIAEEE